MKQKTVTAIAATLAIIFAAVGGYVFCTTLDIESEIYVIVPAYIVAVFIGIIVEQFVHEGAHFMIGGICKMGVKLPKIRLFKSSSVELYPKGDRHIKARFLATVLAGLIFDAMLIVIGVLAFAVPSIPAIIGFAAPYALYSFIINVVPFEYESGKTDGLVATEMIKNEPTALVLINILKIQGQLRDGKFMREIDESLLLDVPQLPEDDLNFIILTQLRYEYYLAVNNDSEAYKYFLRYQDLIQYLPSEYKGGKE